MVRIALASCKAHVRCTRLKVGRLSCACHQAVDVVAKWHAIFYLQLDDKSSSGSDLLFDG